MRTKRRHHLEAAALWSLLLIAAGSGAIRQGTFDWSSMSAGFGAGGVAINLIEARHARVSSSTTEREEK